MAEAILHQPASVGNPALPVVSMPLVLYRDQPVLTTGLLAEFYGTTPARIRSNFNYRRDKFVDGKHVFQIKGEELQRFKDCVRNSNAVGFSLNTAVLTLYPSRGAARHAKMLDTDKAWDVFELLEENYFDRMPVKDQAPQAQPVIPSTVADRKPLERICNLLVDLKYKPAPVKKDYAKVRADVSKYMGVEEWKDLAAQDIPRAVAFVQTQIDALAIEGEPQKALPPGSDTVTLRDYARFYGNLPENPELWHRLEHRAVVAYEAFQKEVLAIHEAAYAPFHERRVSNVGNYFDDVVKPSREMMRMAGDNAHLALRALTDGIHGMAAAWRLLVKG